LRRRRVGFLLIFGALVPLAVAATAWACGSLATLKSGTSVASPNESITLTGGNYSNDTVNNTPVQIRWNSRTGPVIETAIPNAGGFITTDIQVPANASPDWYVVNATQNKVSDGTPVAGTPGRTTLRVQGAAAGAASPWASTPGGGAAVKVGSPPGGTALMPALLGVVLSLGLLGTGLTLVSRSRARRANRPLLGV